MSASASTAVNDGIRVTTWTFERAGDATAWHVHEFDYVIVPVTAAPSPSQVRAAKGAR